LRQSVFHSGKLERMRIFGWGNDGRVPLEPDVIISCRCSVCPVQGQSNCSEEAKDKVLIGVRRDVAEGEGSGKWGGVVMPSREEYPGQYCSIGKAACGDLDLSKTCICETCKVYKDYDLSSGRPVEHFCFNGKALKD
jgi:hypothetical protein